MRYEFFEPRISADTRFFWDGCREHRLLVQKCGACGTLRWPAAHLCPECLSDAVEIAELEGEGILHSYVRFHKPFHPSMQDAVPYITATIDFPSGVRLVSNLKDAENPAIGATVKLEWVDADSYSKPIFEIAED